MALPTKMVSYKAMTPPTNMAPFDSSHKDGVLGKGWLLLFSSSHPLPPPTLIFLPTSSSSHLPYPHFFLPPPPTLFLPYSFYNSSCLACIVPILAWRLALLQLITLVHVAVSAASGTLGPILPCGKQPWTYWVACSILDLSPLEPSCIPYPSYHPISQSHCRGVEEHKPF